VFLAAANRDPVVYDGPDELRPGRGGPPPLSFAFGAHFCLGAALARSEAEVMLGAVVDRWPDLALASPEIGPTWHLRGPFRGVDELRVRTSQ
jgi:cytochrome P450